VNVISRRKLREFYESRPEHSRHAGALEDWFRLARSASWDSFQDARATFGQTDVARDTASKRTATIFDIGGNKYRIITLIDYVRKTVLITHVLTHRQYDAQNWKSSL
jgi:mRNA interferase HigB